MKTGISEQIRMEDLPALCGMAEVIKILPISRASAYRMVERGRMPCVRMGKRIVIPRESLIQWIEREAADSTRKTR